MDQFAIKVPEDFKNQETPKLLKMSPAIEKNQFRIHFSSHVCYAFDPVSFRFMDKQLDHELAAILESTVPPIQVDALASWRSCLFKFRRQDFLFRFCFQTSSNTMIAWEFPSSFAPRSRKRPKQNKRSLLNFKLQVECTQGNISCGKAFMETEVAGSACSTQSAVEGTESGI